MAICGMSVGRVPGRSVAKNPSANAGDVGLTPGLGRSLGEGNGNWLQYSCLDNPMDREAWRATVHGVAKNQTQLRDKTTTITTTVGKEVSRWVSCFEDGPAFWTRAALTPPVVIHPNGFFLLAWPPQFML